MSRSKRLVGRFGLWIDSMIDRINREAHYLHEEMFLIQVDVAEGKHKGKALEKIKERYAKLAQEINEGKHKIRAAAFKDAGIEEKEGVEYHVDYFINAIYEYEVEE